MLVVTISSRMQTFLVQPGSIRAYATTINQEGAGHVVKLTVYLAKNITSRVKYEV